MIDADSANFSPFIFLSQYFTVFSAQQQATESYKIIMQIPLSVYLILDLATYRKLLYNPMICLLCWPLVKCGILEFCSGNLDGQLNLQYS